MISIFHSIYKIMHLEVFFKNFTSGSKFQQILPEARSIQSYSVRDALNSADQYKPVQTSADQRRPARTSEIQNKTDIFNSKLCFYDSANDFPTIFLNLNLNQIFFSNFLFFIFFNFFFEKSKKSKISKKSKKIKQINESSIFKFLF